VLANRVMVARLVYPVAPFKEKPTTPSMLF
jgi:hypothetical protein